MEKAQTETGTRKRRTAEELLEDVRRKKEQLAAREKQLLARAGSQRRKQETHAKILAGAALLEAAKGNEAVAIIVFKDRQEDYQVIRMAFPSLPDIRWETVLNGADAQPKLQALLARMSVSSPSSLPQK